MARDRSQPNDRGAEVRTTTSRSLGTLYVVGTPIGHPDDITLRALATLRRATVIASEDPRVTQALLAHHGITAATVTSYGPLNRHEKVLLLLHRLTQGQDVVLVSDNGTPVIYDPGSLFVAAAHQAGIPVKAIPGPSAMTASAAISGFSGDAIIFDGHLPSSSHCLAQYLSRFRKERRTLVFYVGPRALAGLLKTLVQILPTRQIAIAMNLTTHEETLSRGTPGELLDQIGPVPKDSTVTVVIEGYGVRSQRKMSGRAPRTTRPHGGG
ncbi:MAG: rRNA small subunit methyltransferase 1 [Nitrospirae bacterium]|nr:MAG: rRNA small subunit methyltransferase 1 [Nitrospirota bacterium]